MLVSVILSNLSACGFLDTSLMQDMNDILVSSTFTKKEKAIVLLHGMWTAPNCFQETEQRLRVGLPEDIEIFSPKESETSNKSIAQQAERLSSALLEKGMDKDNYDIILVGHSQGGLRGYELCRTFGEHLSVKGLITIDTPWEGAPAAAITKESVNTYLNGPVMDCCLTGVKCLYPRSETMINRLRNDIFDKYFPTHEPGAQDLAPNSLFLQTIASSLVINQTPILAIAGSNSNVKKVLPSDLPYVYCLSAMDLGVLNSLYARVFAGSMWKKHDMMVPVHSQLAQSITKSTAFKTHTVQDAIHDFLPGLPIPPDKVAYNHPEVIQQTLDFIRKHFEL